jgi:hypothetical protein
MPIASKARPSALFLASDGDDHESGSDDGAL